MQWRPLEYAKLFQRNHHETDGHHFLFLRWCLKKKRAEEMDEPVELNTLRMNKLRNVRPRKLESGGYERAHRKFLMDIILQVITWFFPCSLE